MARVQSHLSGRLTIQLVLRTAPRVVWLTFPCARHTRPARRCSLTTRDRPSPSRTPRPVALPKLRSLSPHLEPVAIPSLKQPGPRPHILMSAVRFRPSAPAKSRGYANKCNPFHVDWDQNVTNQRNNHLIHHVISVYK